MSFDARYLSSTPQGRYPDTGDATGRWGLAKPLPNPFWRSRLRDAWAVWRGRAEIIVWPETPAEPGDE